MAQAELSIGCLTEYYHSAALQQAENSRKVEFSSRVPHVRRGLAKRMKLPTAKRS